MHALPWLRGLIELRPAFAHHRRSDLGYVAVRAFMSPDEMQHADEPGRIQSVSIPGELDDSSTTFLDRRIASNTRSRRAQTLDEWNACGLPYQLVYLRRHVLLGTADSRTLDTFLELAKEAGRLFAGRLHVPQSTYYATAPNYLGVMRSYGFVNVWLDGVMDRALNYPLDWDSTVGAQREYLDEDDPVAPIRRLTGPECPPAWMRRHLAILDSDIFTASVHLIDCLMYGYEENAGHLLAPATARQPRQFTIEEPAGRTNGSAAANPDGGSTSPVYIDRDKSPDKIDEQTENKTPRRHKNPGAAETLLIAAFDALAAKGQWGKTDQEIFRTAGISRDTFYRLKVDSIKVKRRVKDYRRNSSGRGPVQGDQL